jgi:hypothetical protein
MCDFMTEPETVFLFTTTETETIFTEVMGVLTEYFDTWQIGGGDMMEACIKEMIVPACKQNEDDLVKHVEYKVESLKTAFQQSTTGNGSRPTRQDATDTIFMLRTNTHGEISRLPSDFQFPKGGCYDCWTQWNVGNSERQIPPLRQLGPREFLFINNMPARRIQRKGCKEGKASTSGCQVGKYLGHEVYMQLY